MRFNAQKRVLLFHKLRWYQASGGARHFAAPGLFPSLMRSYSQDNSDGRPGVTLLKIMPLLLTQEMSCHNWAIFFSTSQPADAALRFHSGPLEFAPFLPFVTFRLSVLFARSCPAYLPP